MFCLTPRLYGCIVLYHTCASKEPSIYILKLVRVLGDPPILLFFTAQAMDMPSEVGNLMVSNREVGPLPKSRPLVIYFVAKTCRS